MHVYLLVTDNATPERAAALLPGLRALCGQVEYILGAPVPAHQEIAGVIGDHFICRHLTEFVAELAPGAPPLGASKLFNKLIGKEVMLALVDARLWVALVRFLAGDDSLPSDATPGPLTLAHIHIKGFPAQNAGKLAWIKTEAEVLAS